MLIIAPFFYGEFMQLVLYKNLSANNEINKVLTDGTVFNINLKQETDIINPELVLVKLTGIDYNDYNYAEIVELKRFYFIDSIYSVNASLYKLECSTDVLETYKDDILLSEARYKRNIKNGDFLNTSVDHSFIETVERHELGGSMSEGKTMLLTTVGG